MTTKEETTKQRERSSERAIRGMKGAERTAPRNFRHPTGELVSVDQMLRVTQFEYDQAQRLAGILGMSVAGVWRMALYLYADEVDKMQDLAASYEAEVKAEGYKHQM